MLHGRGQARASALVALLLSASYTPPAAAETTAQQSAAAQALFDEARTLMAQGAHAEACPKLEESQRLDPGVGTMLNLAACYEAVGRTASAWSLFLEAAAQANRTAEHAREQVARERAKKLEGRLSKLRVIVPEDVRTVGLRVERTDAERTDAERAAVMGPAQWGAALPIDPGKHKLRATAPGKHTSELEVLVPADGATYTITLSPLRDAPKGEEPSGEEPGFFESLGTQRVVGLSLGAAGVVALGVSGVFSLLALDENDASEANCEGNACNAQGLRDREDALAHGDRATVALIAGGVLVAGGAVLFATGAPEEREEPAVQAMLGEDLIGARIAGAF